MKDGVVSHAAARRRRSASSPSAAAQQPVPTDVKLKDPKDFVYIGKDVRAQGFARQVATARRSSRRTSSFPDMLTAVVAHPPRFGAKRARASTPTACNGMPGVRYVVEVPNGVAVVAHDASGRRRKARDALKVEWDEASGVQGLVRRDIIAEYKQLADDAGHDRAQATATPPRRSAAARKTLEAAYEFPYLAHAAMEPMNCVVKLGADRCEVWNGEQFQTVDQVAVAQVVGLKPEQVKINLLFAGGSFGRRANPASDYVVEAVYHRQGAREERQAGVR